MIWLLESPPHSFRMWLGSWFRCPLCRHWTLKYVAAHGGVVCTSAECEERARRTAKLIMQAIKDGRPN